MIKWEIKIFLDNSCLQFEGRQQCVTKNAEFLPSAAFQLKLMVLIIVFTIFFTHRHTHSLTHRHTNSLTHTHLHK